VAVKLKRRAEITDGGDAPIPAAIIGMAHHLGLEVVAEGVETDHQLELLRTLGCDLAQGWLFGRPEPASAATTRLGRWFSRP
jgi:EAL domain-containing protein (putative c-di-GMP-specific phosphodiesterase class I)